jgi:proline dehydrogenase
MQVCPLFSNFSIVDGIYQRGYSKDHPNIIFAQIYGMGDYLSLSLAQNGFNLSKYLIFGPVRELMPFFSRRLTENADVLGGSKQETTRLFKEIKRRLF